MCGDEFLSDAARCAAQPPPTLTPFVRPTEPNFEPPAPLEGSQFDERLAVTPEFAAMEQLTESLAAMPVSEQAALGFTAADFILQCTYDGLPCNMDRSITCFPTCFRFLVVMRPSLLTIALRFCICPQCPVPPGKVGRNSFTKIKKVLRDPCHE